MPSLNHNRTTHLGEHSYSERANRYARAVVEGRLLASKWTRAACQRHLRDLDNKDFRFTFSTAACERICKFAELLPHEKGQWAARRELIRLENWQCFILCSIFGWLDRETGLRRFREAFILIPRKNGKSLLAAIIGLYMLLLDKEVGAEVYCGAASQKQAFEVFRPAKHFVTASDELRKLTGVTAAAQSIFVTQTGGRFQPVIARPGDGASPHCWIADEFHEHLTPDQVDTAITGMGARQQALLLEISTAGSNTEGPCRTKQSECERVLSGVEENDRLFAVIFQADPEVDWTSQDALVMANPNYGISVEAEWLRDQQAAAVRNAYAQNNFKIKHLNHWVASKSAWLNAVDVEACTDPSLSETDFSGDPCWLGLDLANKVDLAATVRLYRREIDGKPHYYAFASAYLPEIRVNDPASAHYAAWNKQGFLISTDGSATDYDAIEADVLDLIRSSNVQELCFDPWSATQFAQRVHAETSITTVEVPQRIQFLSPAAKELEALLLDRRIHLETNPVLRWCLLNLVAKELRGNIQLDKEDTSKKIDCAMALVTALVRASVQPVSSNATWQPFFA